VTSGALCSTRFGTYNSFDVRLPVPPGQRTNPGIVKNLFALCSFLIRYNSRSALLHQFLTNMSNSPSSRGSARSTSQRPSTSDQTRPSMARAGSLSVAPKSEALRNALQARRAQHSTTPTPREMRSAPPQNLQPHPMGSQSLSFPRSKYAQYHQYVDGDLAMAECHFPRRIAN
jgi:hypothetical protein